MTTLYTKLSLQLSQTLAEMASVMGMGEFKQWFLGQLVPQQAFTDSLQARPSTASNQMCKALTLQKLSVGYALLSKCCRLMKTLLMTSFSNRLLQHLNRPYKQRIDKNTTQTSWEKNKGKQVGVIILQWKITYREEEAWRDSKPAEDFCSRASSNA